MSELLMEAVREQHRRTLDRLEQGEADDVFLDDVLALLDDIRLAGEAVADPADRTQLRALIRFWGGVVYDYTGAYPVIALLPADVDEDKVAKSPGRGSAPPLLWMLAGGACVAIIAAALIIIAWMSRLSPDRAQAMPTPATGPRVRAVAASNSLAEGATPAVGTTAFCRGTTEAIFHVVVEGYEPGVDLRWVLQRDGTDVSTQSALPYGDEDNLLTIRIGTGEPGNLVPGEYTLSLTSGGEAIWVHSFNVLAIAPRAYSFHVSDVPTPVESAEIKREFLPGARAVYLHYQYEGLCNGLDLLHTLYREGEVVEELSQSWRGGTQGEAQVVFEADAGTVFASGEYEVSVAIAGEEHGRASFRILGAGGA